MESNSSSLYHELKKVDAHIHQNVARPALLDIAEKEHFQLVTINTDLPEFPDTQTQQEVALECDKNHSVSLNFLTTFEAKGWGKPGWQEKALHQIKTGWDNGAIAVKIWKNIGMELRDEDGNFVMADDPSFDPIYEYLIKHGIPLSTHLGEPKNCWLPVEKMTVESDKDYFSRNPQYHMYLHEEYPSYLQQIEARNRVLQKHPDLKFIGLHLASLEWSVDKVAEWLDTFPNAGVDLAERVCHLQYQSIHNREKVKSFIETYQDRIIYGSDQIDEGSAKPEDIQRTIREKWRNEFNFFAADDFQNAWNVAKPFQGLGLHKNILKKLFHDNALKYYPRIRG